MDANTGERKPRRRYYKPPKRRSFTGLLVTLLVLMILGIAGGALWFFGFEVPFQEAWNTMPPEGTLRLTHQEDGKVLLQWPQGANAHYYEVLIAAGDRLIPVEDEPDTYENLLHRFSVKDGTSCLLEDFSTGELLTVEVRSCTDYDTPFSGKTRPGEKAITATGTFCAPVMENLRWEPDPEADTLTLRYDLLDNQVCQLLVSLDNGAHTWLMDLQGETPVLSFGTGKTFQMPEYGQVYTFFFGSYIQTASYLHQGTAYEGFSITREDLLGTELNLKLKDEGLNRYTFTWDETKGEGYEVQKWEDDQWVTLAQIPRDGERTFSTGYLDSYTQYRYRVVALGSSGTEPRELEFGTGATAIYNTIWPLMDLKVYTDPYRLDTLGTAKKGTAFSVLDMENDLFKVRFGNYCMINLPEFLGDLCSYNITNSYGSIFMVHGYEIPGVTGTTVTGYENVALGKTDFLVPLLYPTALKLEEAALAAQHKSCRLKIYDAYRPGIASEEVRKVTEDLLTQPIPETTFSKVPALEMPELAEGEILTYDDLMTNDGQYSIGYFISGFGSRHNYGVALDLTLEDAETGQELLMQSAIHDLSHYAVLKRNKENANLLSQIMRGAGFGTLVSEWWHFQDNEATDTLNLKALWAGISVEGWKADNTGWRYRRANGSYYKDCTRTIDGTSYTFDAQGYVIP